MKKVEIYVKLKRELYVDSDDEDTIINNAKEIPSPKKEINIYTKMLNKELSKFDFDNDKDIFEIEKIFTKSESNIIIT